MKKLFTILLVGLLFGSPSLNAQCGNLIIGGVIDGPLSGGTPKGIQFCATGPIADLSIYGVGTANNGGGSDGQEFTFPAETASTGDCFWIGSNTTGWMDFFGFTPCYTSNVASINGDDPIELFCNGAVEDEFGDVALDGSGLCWDHLDGWAVNNSGAPNFGAFDCADWTFSGTNALDGETSNATATTPYPSPAQTCPLLPLPVELYSFEAMAKEEFVSLEWATATETNNDYFEIERSSNGSDYVTIGMMEGAGNSTTTLEYAFNDKAPQKGLNYYRLKQVDYSKALNYSTVEMVKWEQNGSLTLYPTLVNNITNVLIEKESGEKEILVHNLAGAVVTKLSTLEYGTVELDLSNLAAGTYLVTLVTNSSVQSTKIVKN